MGKEKPWQHSATRTLSLILQIYCGSPGAVQSVWPVHVPSRLQDLI